MTIWSDYLAQTTHFAPQCQPQEWGYRRDSGHKGVARVIEFFTRSLPTTTFVYLAIAS